MKRKLILIAGGTASGKTFLSNRLLDYLTTNNNHNAVILRLDYYYKRTEILEKELNGKKINWDHPDAIDWTRLKDDIKKILDGKAIYNQIYNFDKNDYERDENLIVPADFIILEGTYALYDKEILTLANHKFFIKTKKQARFTRRLKRDSLKRYKTFDFNAYKKRWREEIYPMHKRYIEPTKKRADLIIKNDRLSTQNYQKMARKIESKIEI